MPRLISLSAATGLVTVVIAGYSSSPRGANAGPPAGRGATQAPPKCTYPDRTHIDGPTVVSDLPDGVSSDGRGPYVEGSDGVWYSSAGIGTVLALRQRDSIPFWSMLPATGVEKPRKIKVNLNNPVPGGGGVRLGIVDGYHLLTQWKMVGSALQNVHTMKIGERSTVPQMNVGFSFNGRQHLLQMGPQPNGHCHDSTVIHGAGTSSAAIYRASETKWVVDLPAESMGRLFDVDDEHARAIDKGLYHIRIHYEVGK